MAALTAVATLRLWRGRTLPLRTAGLYALGAVVPPLLALVLAYLRVTQFDRSISFALFAVALAGAFYFVADRLDKIGDKTPAIHLAIGAFASGVAAAMTLAFVMVLDRGYLTVAFAVTALTTSIFAVVDRIAMLRYVVVAIGIIVLGRLAWDPRIMGADVGTWPIFNWLLLGYGAPAVAFLGAGWILKREGEDLAVRLCDALGLLFAALLFFFQIRHALNGGDPLAPASGHVEQGLFALTSLGFAAVLVRMDLARANPVFRIASLVFGVVSAIVVAIGLGLVENPLFNRDPVGGPVLLSTLLLAYLLPGLAAVVLARIARGVRPNWYVTGVAVSGPGADLPLRHAGGASRLPGADHFALAGDGRARGLVLLRRLARARSRLPRLRPGARLARGAHGIRRAGRALGHQGLPLRPDGHRRLLARVLGDLPRRGPDRHRARLPEAHLCPSAGAPAGLSWGFNLISETLPPPAESRNNPTNCRN